MIICRHCHLCYIVIRRTNQDGKIFLQISCVGGFGSNTQMYKINGSANINAIRAAAEQGRQMLLPYHFPQSPLSNLVLMVLLQFKDFHDVYTGIYSWHSSVQNWLIFLIPFMLSCQNNRYHNKDKNSYIWQKIFYLGIDVPRSINSHTFANFLLLLNFFYLAIICWAQITSKPVIIIIIMIKDLIYFQLELFFHPMLDYWGVANSYRPWHSR